MKTKAEKIEGIKQILSDVLGVTAEKIQPNTCLKDELGADSIDLIVIVQEIENTFNLSIHDDDAEKLTTLESIIDYLESHNHL